ncbi:UPF0158 family protein [Phytohabitans sp. LJ34]|uniref:UPF0158 family protein n=1 Tax=Phytohabitans sp. LJ34 TaxID=3452217 RepID=UPI003F8B540B
MADFADGISNEQAQRRLERAIRGRGAFRRFREELYEEYPDLVAVWNAYRESRAQRRAVAWLVDNGSSPRRTVSASWPSARSRRCPNQLQLWEVVWVCPRQDSNLRHTV